MIEYGIIWRMSSSITVLPLMPVQRRCIGQRGYVLPDVLGLSEVGLELDRPMLTR